MLIVDVTHLAGLLQWQTVLLERTAHLNRRTFNRETFTFLCFNIPFNIYSLSRLLYGMVPTILVFIVTLIQLICLFTISLSAVALNRTIHASEKYFPAIQFRIADVSIHEKWHLLTMYEQLRCEQSQLGFSVGPLGVITANNFFKFLIFYIVYALFTCSIIG